MKKVFCVLLHIVGWCLFAMIAFFILSRGFSEYKAQKKFRDIGNERAAEDALPKVAEMKEANNKALKMRDSEQWKALAEFAQAHYKEPNFNFRYAFATAFVNGKELPKDYKKAVEILSFETPKNWSARNSLAQIANLYDLGGEGLERDAAMSEKYLDTLFDKASFDDSDSPFATEDPDDEKRFGALTYLAFRIYTGHEYFSYPPDGFPPNKSLGLRILQRVLESSPPLDSNALAVVGNLYKREGKSDDFIKVQGKIFDNGGYDVGYDYVNALLFGSQKDEARAFEVMKKTADFVNSGGKNTNAAPWYNLYVAVMYKNGIGTEKNPSEFRKYFDKAKVYYEKEAKDGQRYESTWAVEDIASSGALHYFGKNRREAPRLHDEEVGLALIELADRLTEKYANKTGNADLLSFYKRANMPDKVKELYERYAARSPKFRGEYERYLKSLEDKKTE